MKLTLAEIAHFVGGHVEGSPDIAITHLARIEEGVEGALSFLYNPKYLPHLYSTRASAVIVSDALQLKKEARTALVRVADPQQAFKQLLDYIENQQPRPLGIDPRAVIAPDAVIGQDCYIGPGAYVGPGVVLHDNVQVHANVYLGHRAIVGEGSILYPNAYVGPTCELGMRCILQPGAVIGADGFGFIQQPDGTNVKIPQLGNVVLEDDVEIGANTTVDRATVGSTIVHTGVKLDNLIHIGHNCEIGQHTVMAGLTGVSGSTRIGKYCMIGGQVGFVGHISIGDRIMIGGQTGVTKSLETPGPYRGSPVLPYRDQLRLEANQRSIPDLLARIQKLEELVESLAKPA